MLHIRNLTMRTCGWLRYSSSSTAPFVVRSPFEKSENTEGSATTLDVPTNISANGKDRRLNTGMVAAAFASLHTVEEGQTQKSVQNKNLIHSHSKPFNTTEAKLIDEKVVAANTVNSLLATTENVTISRRHALRVVSILAEWTTTNKAKLSDFESDSRFIKICRVLGKSAKNNGNNNEKKNVQSYRTEDLNTVLGVTGDDEAAKLIASISLPQMVKVMSTLAQQKRRSTPLLRSLAFNITRCTDPLDLKQCADLLYAMSVLNFPDNVLIDRVCADVHVGLDKNADKPAVVGSLLTSLGLLKYKEIDVLEGLSEWVLKHYDICRPQDIAALLLTLATLNYTPTNSDKLYQVLPLQLTSADFSKSTDWLDVVWALTCLRTASEEQISSVLSELFIDSLLGKETGLSFTVRMKLLNINAAAKLLVKDYKGPLISDANEIHSVHINYSKQKQVIVSAILDTLKSLLPSETYLTTCKNTNMGFLIDAECYLDSKCNPLPVSSKSDTSGTRVAILALDYHDMCHNTSEPHGVANLCINLLKAQGYEVLTVPHSEFHPRDKLIKRVQYLEAKLKQIACSSA